MSDPIDQTPRATGVDRFIAELGDTLERHARTRAASAPIVRVPRAGRWSRRVAVSVAAGTVAAVALAVSVGTEHTGEPAVASASVVMRQSADALPHESGGLLPVDSYWHTVVDVAMRHVDEGVESFEYTVTQRWETWQSRDGSGRERLTNGAVEFVTPADRSSWQAAGSPVLTEPASDRRLVATDRPFALGSDAVSYAELEDLPTEPQALARVVSAMVERQRSEIPATFGTGEARAYVLFELIRDAFEAPTSPELRAALYDLMASVPRLELAGATRDHAGRAGTAVAVVLGDARFELVIDPETGTLLEARRILLRPSNQFPGMTPGLISRATFLRSDVVRTFAR